LSYLLSACLRSCSNASTRDGWFSIGSSLRLQSTIESGYIFTAVLPAISDITNQLVAAQWPVLQKETAGPSAAPACATSALSSSTGFSVVPPSGKNCALLNECAPGRVP